VEAIGKLVNEVHRRFPENDRRRNHQKPADTLAHHRKWHKWMLADVGIDPGSLAEVQDLKLPQARLEYLECFDKSAFLTDKFETT